MQESALTSKRPVDPEAPRASSRRPCSRVLLGTLLVAALSAVCSLSIAFAVPAATADAAGPSAAERVPIDPAAVAAAPPAAPALLVALDASAPVANAVADASAVAPGDDTVVLDTAAPGDPNAPASEAAAADVKTAAPEAAAPSGDAAGVIAPAEAPFADTDVVSAPPELPKPAPASVGGYRQHFLDTAVGLAQDSERQTGVPAAVTLAQAILESDWGLSGLARDANNYFGIKAIGAANTSGVYRASTWEVVDDEDVLVVDNFAAYATPEDSFVDHGQFFLRNPRYAPALRLTADPRLFAQAIGLAGYASDPAYADKLIGLMDRYNLYQYGVAAPTPPKTPGIPAWASSDAPPGAIDVPFDCHCWVLPVNPGQS